jgi:hypothetical protein
MVWTYVNKNWLYLNSLTLDDNTTVQQHVQTLSTFRFIPITELKATYKPLLDPLTPSAPSQESQNSGPKTDAQNSGIVSNVKQIVTEISDYKNSVLLDDPQLMTIDDYNLQGNLVSSVEFNNNAPRAVRLYGYRDGERMFREMRKFPPLTSATKNAATVNPPTPTPKDFRIVQKYDATGQLVEYRIVGEKKDLESFVYDRKGKKVEHLIDTSYFTLGTLFNLQPSKVVSALDDKGNPVDNTVFVNIGGGNYSEDHVGGVTYTTVTPRYKEEKTRHQYTYDERGNWIKRTTSSVDKNGALTPLYVTYRTIIYN